MSQNPVFQERIALTLITDIQTSHRVLYLLHFSAFPSRVPELQKGSSEPLQGQQAEYQVTPWSVSVDAKHSAALHPTPTVRKTSNIF